MHYSHRNSKLLLLAASLSAALSANADPEYVNGNMFIGPIIEDMVAGHAATVPGGAYWDADATEQSKIESKELAKGECSTQWGRTWTGIMPYSC